MKKIKIGIVNVTGYAGIELARLLVRHPGVELVSVTGRSAAGQKLAEVFPHLAGATELTIESELGNVDFAFVAMPHKESALEVMKLIRRGIKVVDISADFRLSNPDDYIEWYGFSHPSPELLDKAVYGLPELYRKDIASAELVANPGCYPTSAILALAPAVKNNIVDEDIIIDSKSGVSGAGRTLAIGSHYSEANENTCAYALKGHRHLPEIVQELAYQGGEEVNVTFVPHLVPMTRGILSTCYAALTPEYTSRENSQQEITAIYKEFYKDEPFVKVVDAPPHTKNTWGSNMCHIYSFVDARTGRLIVVSCIDNLMKGAAGQAIQNMNIMSGFAEVAGLEAPPIYP
ncbi:MAG: N-acetyl-gamma-glutamyl-phosphate reductase [Dehalococcoidales bacterium]|nr:N-acetyl-gamma-glutamyl-phosphate reductase [Dehalococcoidales bacterium]